MQRRFHTDAKTLTHKRVGNWLCFSMGSGFCGHHKTATPNTSYHRVPAGSATTADQLRKIGSVWELTQEMSPYSAQCLVRRSVHIHASIYGVFSVSSRNGLEPCSFIALARVFSGTGNHGNPANQFLPLQDERVDTVQEEPNVQPEFYLRDDTDGMRSPWNVTLRRKHCLKLSFLAWF